jgi:hypothetical protein
MRSLSFGLVVSSVIACAACAACAIEAPVESQSFDQVTAQLVPMRSGEFIGYYVVPAPSDIASAATFGMTEVEWTVANGVATLHYDLPVGLVGGDRSVSLSGPISATSTSVNLTSTNGTGTCTATGNLITCSEELANLGSLPISQAVIAQTAVTDGQPVASRMQIASLFSSDPIGTVGLDLSAPSTDGGGHHGGHGGGGRH